jgi:hypothetical protein
MALQIWDGYDHYNDESDFLARSGFLQYGVGGQSTIQFVTGRNGVQRAVTWNKAGLSYTGFNYVFQQRVASAFVGFALNLAQGLAPVTFEFYDSIGARNQCTFMFRFDNYSFGLFKGNAEIAGVEVNGDGGGPGTPLYLSGNNAFTPASWFFVEIWPTIDSSAGSFEVRFNNIVVANVTGVDTQVTSNAWWDIMYVSGASGEGVVIDDFYYGDTTTGAGIHPAESPIGDCHVATLFAVGNNSVQWTPLTGTNWQEVSEISMDSDTSYNYSPTVGQEDLLNFGALPSGTVVVFGVQLTGAYRKDDSGGRQIKQAVKSGSTEVYGPDHALGEELYVYFTDQWILDPNTDLNWTVSGVNAMAAGYNVAA